LHCSLIAVISDGALIGVTRVVVSCSISWLLVDFLLRVILYIF
jgi:hypothetical protein